MSSTTQTTTNSLLQGIKTVSSFKNTENGAVALNTTQAPLLDLFGEIGALRMRDEKDIITLFMKAYGADKLLALKTLFYARDIRGGLGERRTFRTIIKHLANNYPGDIVVNIDIIPEYGRWDDLYCLFDTPVESAALDLIKNQFGHDMDEIANATLENRSAVVSLLGKWLPSENASSARTRILARKISRELGLVAREYRKALTALRSAIKIVETKMSSNEWSTIDYAAVPSVASLRYRNAFKSHDAERYEEFITRVNNGEAKINAATLYPYDLVKKYLSPYGAINTSKDGTVEAQWKALPNYLENTSNDFLIMADVSGSMFSDNLTPIATSVGLAIYFAERSKGAFAGNFITFTNTPRLREIPANLTLADKVALVTKDVGYDTNLEKAFKLVLDGAIRNNVKPEDMPTAIVIISDIDMEINCFGSADRNLTFTQSMADKFAAAGYKMPTLVYWNVCARQDTFHAVADDNVRFVSGSSPAVFKGLCEHLGYSATELMLAVLNDPHYDAVRAA